MFKKLTLDQLFKIKTNFFKNLKSIYTKKKYTTFSEFIKHYLKDLNEVYFLEWGDFSFKIEKKENWLVLIDNKEKIFLELTNDEIKALHNFLKNWKINQQRNENLTILQKLLLQFRQWQLNAINWKPFIVYDIETIWNTDNLKNTKFAIWYSIISNENHSNNLKFRFISEKNLKKFVEFLLNFDWYIIGYNQISFDNPVIIYNTNLWEQELEILNKKSIDLFLFIWNLTGRRLWLDNVSKALVGIKKTLSSWLEGEKLLREYEKTGEKKLLEKVKNYCKNDVKMTLWVLLYFLTHNKIFIDGKEYEYTFNQFLKLASSPKDKKEEKKQEIKWLF